ncbi:DUF1648 domain-containing protein [Microbacterium paraoxydans]|uniref:DUF1648 domain-containing protein n=1 Tax=Microbacterium paraoxydans TaxID=199592 RepID=UPI001CF9CCB2|nr:DUF1648 domain-containing protein [Microbacterium paraoxydans]
MTTYDLTRTPQRLLKRARWTFSVVAVLVPIVITAAALVVLLSWLPSLPEEVATHWGVNGADAFGPATTYLWLLLGAGFGLPLLIAVTTLLAVGSHWGGAARLMGALAAGMAAFAAVASIGSLAIQRDLADASDTPGIGGVVALAFAAFLILGGAAWALQPRVRAPRGRTLEPRYAVHIEKGERVVWIATTSMPRGVIAFLLVVLLGLVALAAYLLGTGTEGGAIVTLVVLVVGVALAATASFRIAVTPEGFGARSLLGWPRVRIPVDEVESARAVDISPFGEFGGWGWRIAVDGRSGIVLRRGPAIEVSRRGRRPFIVTIDGAEEAAALLQAYVDRARTSGTMPTDSGKETS